MSGPAEGREARLHISVVVPSWRDGKNLAILLPALSRLEGVAETIVVDAIGVVVLAVASIFALRSRRATW